MLGANRLTARLTVIPDVKPGTRRELNNHEKLDEIIKLIYYIAKMILNTIADLV